MILYFFIDILIETHNKNQNLVFMKFTRKYRIILMLWYFVSKCYFCLRDFGDLNSSLSKLSALVSIIHKFTKCPLYIVRHNYVIWFFNWWNEPCCWCPLSEQQYCHPEKTQECIHEFLSSRELSWLVYQELYQDAPQVSDTDQPCYFLSH